MKFLNLVTTTPVGDFSMVVALDENGPDAVIASGFEGIEKLYARAHLTPNTLVEEHAHPYITLVQEYFSGNLDALSMIPIRIEGSDLEKGVWRSMRKILPGSVASYKSIAAEIGRPGAARAVGAACGRNQLILLTPCHRVVRSDGKSGGYIYGSAMKRHLLEHEHAPLR